MEAKSGAKLKGKWEIEVFDKDGNFISSSECHNIVTNEGLDRVLNVMLHAATQLTTWYCLLFEDNYAPLAGDTYDVPGFTECEAYDEATRPEYVEAASVARSTTNSANKVVFTMNDTKTLYGAALVSLNTKGDHAADPDSVLYCGAKFGAAQPVIATNVVNLTYTSTSADDGV